jgi:tetratricopeptide (TPR) repeat protein
LAFSILFCFSISSISSAQVASDFNSVAAAAAAARDRGDQQDAIRLYQQAVNIHPDWTEGWWYLGTLCYDADRYGEAITALKKATELSPEVGPAWSFLGLSEFEMKNYAEAKSDLEKGIAIGNSDDPEVDRVARFHLALLLIRGGDFDRAKTILEPQFTSPPVSDQARTALGLLLLRVPALPQEIDPSKDAILAAAGDLQLQLGTATSGEALARIHKIVVANQDQPVAHEILARCFDALHIETEAAKERAAIASARKNTAWSPGGDKEVLAFLSRDAFDRGSREFATAAADSAEFEKLSRGAAGAEQSGDPRTAIALYEQALQLRPDWDEGRFKLSMLYYSLQQFSSAIASLKVWLERNPNSGTGWAVLGLSEFEAREFDNALIHLQRGYSLGLGASEDSIRRAHYHEAILLNRKKEFSRAAQILSADAGPGVLADEISFALGVSFLRIPHFPEEVGRAQRPLVQRTGEAAVLLAGSKYDLALPKLHDLVRDFPQAPFLHYVYGSVLSSLSLFDEAATQFEIETRISPQSELPFVELASLNLQRHAEKDAIAPAKRAVQLAPTAAAAHYVLGRAYLEMAQIDAAIQELSRAAELSPGSPEIQFHLARAYARKNLPEKATAERAVFARLNALAEQQRSAAGSQSYGAFQPDGVSVALPDSQRTSPSSSPPQ